MTLDNKLYTKAELEQLGFKELGERFGGSGSCNRLYYG